MKKKLFKILSIFLSFGISIYIYFYASDYVKYTIMNNIVSPLQNKYENSSYYKFKVPNEWFLIRRDNDYTTFIGPVWSNNQKLTSVLVFTDFDNLLKYINYFNKDNCKDIDLHAYIKNTLFIKSKIEKSIESDGEIIFCNSDDENNSYVAYFNKGAITTMLIKPYSKKYKKQYIKLFENIDYIILEDEIPEWILEN